MVTTLTVTIDDWIWEAIEDKKRREKKNRSEVANELLAKALKVTVNIE